MKDLNAGELIIKNKTDGDSITMEILGKSRERNPAEVLNPYFDDIMGEVSGKNLIVDFRNLEYMNSSTVPPIIQFIKKLNDNSISTDVEYDKESTWQCASFKALETISLNMEHITITGK